MRTPPAPGAAEPAATTHPLFAVGVVMPVRDEARRVARAIRSVRRSLAEAHVTDSCIVVVADRCTDGTAAIAHDALRTVGLDRVGLVIEVDHGNVGAARATGSRAVLERLGTPPRWTWLLGIDGDSQAPRDWVRRHLAHADRGTECVSGIVELDRAAPAALRRRFETSYRNAVGHRRHDHVHGTNFGIRGDTLLAADNWPALATGEDQALWARVGSLGRAVAQDPSIIVTTSARLDGRAPAGFSADLAALGVDQLRVGRAP